MAEGETVRRGIVLDTETDRLLRAMARRFEGNLSMAMREAIRMAARQTQTPAIRQPQSDKRG